MKYLIFRAWLCGWMLSLAYVAHANPVVVELFTSANQCKGCSDAESAVVRLLDEFPEDEYLLHIYSIDDAYETRDGIVRWNFYNSPTFPTIFFNGIHHITGANAKVINTYRNTITDQIAQPPLGRLLAWYEKQDSGWVTSATFALFTDFDTSDMDIFVSVTDSTLPNRPDLVQSVKSLGKVERFYTQEFVTLELPDIEITDTTSIRWFVQLNNTERNLRDVFLAAQATSSPPPVQDLNYDGVIDKQDVLFFSLLWGRDLQLADFNGDGVVNGLDLLIMTERKP